MSKIKLKAISMDSDKFMNAINPDQIIENYEGILTYNTGIYGNRYDNAMPLLLIDLYQNSSSVHQNLVNLKASLILGNNLQAENDEDSPILNPFISKRNKSGDNLKTVYFKASKDFALFNSAVLQVVFNSLGQVVEVYHIPVQNFRLGVPNKYGQIEYGYISTNWGIINNSSRRRSLTKDSTKIRMWDPSLYKEHPVQLVYLKDYSYSEYALPSYNAVINWLLISREISNFHLNNIKSNFFLSGLLTMKRGGMSEQEIQESAYELEKLYKGGTGRKVLLSYVDDLINDKPVFENLSPDRQDETFKFLSEETFKQIISGHQAYPILGGLETQGGDLGGSSNRLVVSIQAFDNLVTANYRQILLDGLNMICNLNNLPALNVILEPPKITLPTPQNEDTTRSERRSILYGLPPLDVDENQDNNANNSNQIGI